MTIALVDKGTIAAVRITPRRRYLQTARNGKRFRDDSDLAATSEGGYLPAKPRPSTTCSCEGNKAGSAKAGRLLFDAQPSLFSLAMARYEPVVAIVINLKRDASASIHNLEAAERGFEVLVPSGSCWKNR